MKALINLTTDPGFVLGSIVLIWTLFMIFVGGFE